MSAISDDVVGNVDFNTFMSLIESRVKELDDECTAAVEVVENAVMNNTEVLAARACLARFRAEATSLLRTLDISAVAFRVITKLDHLTGDRGEASKAILVRMVEDSRRTAKHVSLSVDQLSSIEKYYDATVENYRRLKRDLTDEEKGWVQTTIIAMIK